jgi:multidrug efflux pump subunit AcrA (membrane-fusion protein)
LTVPAQAVSRTADGDRVFVLHDGVAREQTVQTGARSDGRILITDGLQAGDTVIVTPHPALADGTAVQPTTW